MSLAGKFIFFRKLKREKIEGVCGIAVSDGFEYIWIDTCCIDKTSSAELSEAINSMFRWYYFEKDFRDSRCLQELIALSRVVFYNNTWEDLGTKFSFKSLISEITGIPGQALLENIVQNNELTYRLSIAQRMSWASRRRTTREEDRAYSLLGIFGINMPMLYGEGKAAFHGLQEEIYEKI
ncbi:hypothetical protein BKA61DRAFT_632289 [Leptodontidium sp. MPI-SDFR-AT-0119]|nr:hypothetical protein BKA61DRAFT_632289 [Leptodontidium sp. MPI-SDFR-AT-0119]